MTPGPPDRPDGRPPADGAGPPDGASPADGALAAPAPPGFTDAPDRWAEADRAWEAKWSENPDAPDAAPAPPPPGHDYTPTRPTPAALRDAYGEGIRGAGPYLGLGAQIGGAMALFVGGGYLADRFLGTSPWGVLVGAALGMVGVIALVVRLANEANKKR